MLLKIRIESDDQLVAELLRLLRAKNAKLRALSVHANVMVGMGEIREKWRKGSMNRD